MIQLQLDVLTTFRQPIPLGIAADWIEEQAGGINAQLLMYWLRLGKLPPLLTNGGYGSGSGSGSGTGDGDGNGYGYGHGYGNGNGDGYGSGTGSGTGDGDGYGAGHGYGTGYGDGNGAGNGHGHGHGSGHGDGYGHGHGHGRGSGSGKLKNPITVEDFVPNLNDPVIVRSRDQGCVFGLYQGHAGREVILKNARQIWSWQSNRLTLIDVGQTKATAENVRLSQVCEELVMLEACGMISCTAAAAKSLASLPAATRN